MASGIFQPGNPSSSQEGIGNLLNLPNATTVLTSDKNVASNNFTDYKSNPIYQNFLRSSFYDPRAMGPQVITPITLPTGEILNLPNAATAEQFRQYLSSTPAGGAPITIPTPVTEPFTPATGLPVGTPTPILSSPTSSSIVSLPTTPEPTIPGFQSFSGYGREGIMNLLASRFRDLNLGMMNMLRNNPGSFYSRSPLDQTSLMPSGLQNLFFRIGNNLMEIPNSTNMIRRTIQRPSYTNTGIATSFVPNFVPFEKRKRR